MSLRALVVEDNAEIRAFVRSALQVEGFEIQTAASVADAIAQIRNTSFDFILLDLGLPDGDGAQVLREARLESNVPVLIVSARDQEHQKIELLDAGADDYLTKPFSVGELMARIRVCLRHRGTSLAPAIVEHSLDGFHVDLKTREVTVDDQPIHLTPTEYDLLARLVRSAGRVVTHRQLLLDVWGPEYTDHTHYLRLYMGQLRAKIEATPAEPRHLLTEAGVGYRLAVS